MARGTPFLNKELTLHNIDRRKTKAASLFAFPKITTKNFTDTLLHVVANTAVAADKQEILQTTWGNS
uniref:Z7r protein n=1 Tax=Vibrio cholerae TaxID=666 RepID=O87023_VIBCL|nr:z7r [Vibrio cholerae]